MLYRLWDRVRRARGEDASEEPARWPYRRAIVFFVVAVIGLGSIGLRLWWERGGF